MKRTGERKIDRRTKFIVQFLKELRRKSTDDSGMITSTKMTLIKFIKEYLKWEKALFILGIRTNRC